MEEDEDRRVQHNMQVTIVYLIRFSSLTIIGTGDGGAGGGGLTDDAGISIRYASPSPPLAVSSHSDVIRKTRAQAERSCIPLCTAH